MILLIFLCSLAAVTQFVTLRSAARAGFTNFSRGHAAAQDWLAVTAIFQVATIALLNIAYQVEA